MFFTSRRQPPKPPSHFGRTPRIPSGNANQHQLTRHSKAPLQMDQRRGSSTSDGDGCIRLVSTRLDALGALDPIDTQGLCTGTVTTDEQPASDPAGFLPAVADLLRSILLSLALFLKPSSSSCRSFGLPVRLPSAVRPCKMALKRHCHTQTM